MDNTNFISPKQFEQLTPEKGINNWTTVKDVVKITARFRKMKNVGGEIGVPVGQHRTGLALETVFLLFSLTMRCDSLNFLVLFGCRRVVGAVVWLGRYDALLCVLLAIHLSRLNTAVIGSSSHRRRRS